MMTDRRMFRTLLAAGLAVLFAALPASVARAQDEAGEAPPANGSILIRKMDWVLSDMMRCIEELRRIQDPAAKRYLVEEMENILYEEVEFPLLYQQADNANALDVEVIGVTSDVVDAGEANPLAAKYAEAFALMGIARGYEGYAAAASDYIETAQSLYGNVLALKVRIDTYQDPKTLSQWMADARGSWGSTAPIRVTFYGRSVSQEVIDGLNLQNVRFQTEESVADHYLGVARHDFLNGIRRRIATDDVLHERRVNRFHIYLPGGSYRLVTRLSADYGNQVDVQTNPNRNHYLIETLEDGITLYPVNDVRELLEQLEREGAQEETGGGLTGSAPAEAPAGGEEATGEGTGPADAEPEGAPDGS